MECGIRINEFYDVLLWHISLANMQNLQHIFFVVRVYQEKHKGKKNELDLLLFPLSERDSPALLLPALLLPSLLVIETTTDSLEMTKKLSKAFFSLASASS